MRPTSKILETGVIECLKTSPEFTLDEVLQGIIDGRYAPIIDGDSFVLLEVYEDDHFKCRCLNIFMAYSPPTVSGFMKSVALEIAEYAASRGCSKVVCQSYYDGYQKIIDAGKLPIGVRLTPYMTKYVVELI